MATIEPGSFALHYKGGLYRVQGSCVIEASLEEGVLYQAMDPNALPHVWMRPLSDFQSKVAPGVPRFSVLPSAKETALRRALLPEVLPEQVLEQVRARYQEQHRFYHGWNHILRLFETAEEWGERWSVSLTLEQMFAILFHDIVYQPGAPTGTNEADSVALMMAIVAQFKDGPYALPTYVSWSLVSQLILDTVNHTPSHPQSDAVIALDLSALAGSSIEFQVSNALVELEFQHLLPASEDRHALFLKLRKEFLEKLRETGPVFPRKFEQLETGFKQNLAML